MKRFITYLVMLFAAVVVAKGAETTPAERWEIGNKAYIEGKYNLFCFLHNSLPLGIRLGTKWIFNFFLTDLKTQHHMF